MRTGENRWPVIRRYLDEHFKETYGNWWTATRHDIRSYEEFKIALKARYWSDATQNVVRESISYGTVSYTHLFDLLIIFF